MAKFTPEQFRLAMERAPAALFLAVSQQMLTRARLFVQGTMVRKRLSGRPGLINRGGGFRRSFDVASTGSDLRTFRMVEFTTHPGARIQEEGGRITPKRSKFLAIPLDAAKTGNGLTRAPIRSYKDTYLLRGKTGAYVVMQRKGKDSVPLFLLYRGVAVPARLGFEQEWRADQESRKSAIGDAVERVLANLK